METVQQQTEAHILVADEVWCALAMLHRNHPQRVSFSAKEILEQVKAEHAHTDIRAGVQAHIYLHNVANLEPNSARYRMFYRLEDDTYRLYRTGDPAHPLRKGKIVPNRAELPARYHDLLDWYEREYSKGGVLEEPKGLTERMWGVGRHLWADVKADEYVNDLRKDWEGEPSTREARVWRRIADHQGEEFHTKTGLPFTYEVEGHSGIWFHREGHRINKRLGRQDVEKAIVKCPLEKVIDIRECFDPAYLFALLMDHRIRGTEW